MPTQHFPIGGSTAARTINCPGWRQQIIDLGITLKPVDSDAAQEGTALHAIMEQSLRADDPELYIENQLGQIVGQVKITADHIELMLDAYDAYLDLCDEMGGEVQELIEETLELTPEIGGTPDVIVTNGQKTYVVDWKFGQGVAVSPENNMQGLFYFHLLDAHPRFANVFTKNRALGVAIIQPMPSRDINTLKTWDIPKGALAEFAAQLEAARTSTRLCAGAHCQFCPAAPLCPEKEGTARTALLIPSTSLDKLNENIALAYDVQAWAGQVLKFAHEQMELGANLPDWKLVMKRATRRWIDESKIVAAIQRKFKLPKKALMTEPQPLSPAQMEKVLKQNKLDISVLGDYTEQHSSGTTLAKADDPREAVLSSTAFKDAMNRLQ